MAHASDDFEVKSRFLSVPEAILRGREGVVAWWNDLADAWDWIEAELEDSMDVRADQTVILLTLLRRPARPQAPTPARRL